MLSFISLGGHAFLASRLSARLGSESFEVLMTEFSPKKLGSFVFEVELCLWLLLKIPSASTLLYPLLYPIRFFERHADANQPGDELLIKARKKVV
jgi:hypothetical protein